MAAGGVAGRFFFVQSAEALGGQGGEILLGEVLLAHGDTFDQGTAQVATLGRGKTLDLCQDAGNRLGHMAGSVAGERPQGKG